MRGMGRVLGSLWMVCCAVVCLTPAQDAEAPESRSAAPGHALVEIRAEMMVVGKEGSRRAGSERAVLAYEKVGLLRTSTSFPWGGADPQDEVSVELRVRARHLPDGLHLSVDSRAQAQPSGELVIRSGGGLLTGTSPLFFEAYVSPATGERVVFLLSVHPWEAPPRDLASVRSDIPRPVAYLVRIYRLTDEEPEMLESPRLSSLVGYSASYSFGFILEEEGEEHREELEIRLQAVELRDGWLSGILSLEGEVGGRSVSSSRGWSLPSGGEAEIDLRLEGGEGRDLGFRIRVDVRF